MSEMRSVTQELRESPSDTSLRKDAYRHARRLGAGLRLLLLGAGAWLALNAPAVDRRALAISLAIYTVLALLLWAAPGTCGITSTLRRGLLLAGLVLDVLFVTWLIHMDGGWGSSLYLLYPVWMIQSILVYPRLPEAMPLAFLFAPLYVGVLFVESRSLYFLQSREFLMQYALLFAATIAGIYVAHVWQAHQSRVQSLSEMIRTQDMDIERKALMLQRTASNLSERVVELRSIQEGFKAISSALALDDVLQLIVDNASRVLDKSSCYLALMRPDAERPTLATVALPDAATLSADARAQFERVAAWIVNEGRPFSLSDADGDAQHVAGDNPLPPSLIGAPLFVDDRPIGALMSTNADNLPFEPDQVGLLAAFADQAAVAVKNAWLYRDLSVEQRRSEEKSNELEAILRGIGDGVIVTDRHLNLLMINPRAAQIFGLAGMPALGHPLSEVVHNPDLQTLLKEVQGAPAEVVMQEIALEPVRDRQPVYQGLGTTVINAEGRVSGIVTVLRDITGQKELDRMKSNFLSVISHELKTPLHSIKGFVDIILMGKTGEINDIQRDFLDTVKEQTTQLQRLISDLLEFSRLESGQIKLQPRELPPASLITEVVDKLTPLAAEGGVHLYSTVPAGFPAIEADPVRIEQVFSNLVDNAIKFTPAQGRVTIRGEDLGEVVRLRVEDTGVGIPEEERERIFDRFYQVESGSTRAYRGTGLGLTICKHIVEQHQGRIWVEGGENSGAVFVVELPKVLSQEEDLALDFSTLPSRSKRQN